MNKSHEKGTKTYKTRRFSTIAIVEILVSITLFLVSVAIYLIGYKQSNHQLELVGVILMASTFVVGCLLIIIRAFKFNKSIQIKEKEIVDQLNEFSKGRIVLKYPKSKDEVLGYLQGEISKNISQFSAPLDTTDEESLNFVSNELIHKSKFEKLLISWVSNNNSAKSGLIFIKIEGDDDHIDQYIDDLRNILPTYFGEYYISLYAPNILSVYVLNIDNIFSFEENCKNVIAKSNELFVSNYTESNLLYNIKIAGAIYPYINATSLFETALEELSKNAILSINTGELKVTNPGNFKGGSIKTTSYLYSFEKFTMMFNEATCFAERLNIIDDYVRWFTENSSFDAGGVIIYDKSVKAYRVLFESNHNDTEFFALTNGTLDAEDIEKLYEKASSDPYFICYNTKTLPKETALFLQNHGISSIFLSIITLNHDNKALIYTVGKKPISNLSAVDLGILIAYSSMCSKLVNSVLNEQRNEQYEKIINSMLKKQNQFLTTVNKNTYEVTYLSNSLKSKYKNFESGDKCYEVFMNAKKPCDKCPMVHGKVKKIFENISSLETTVSNIMVSGLDDDLVSLLIEQKNENLISPQNKYLYNEELMIKNERSLVIALGKELKSANSGFILSCRLNNMARALAIKGTDEKLVLGTIIQNIENLGYGDILYQLDKEELSFLLTGFNKKDVYYFVEEISEAMGKLIPIGFKGFEPKFCWSLISYPIELNTESKLIPLAKGELDRSEHFGIGYLAEIANNHPRRARRNEYIEDTINIALHKDIFPINVQPIVSASNGRIKYGNVFYRLVGNHADKISPSEFIPIAEKTRRTVSLDAAVVKSSCQLYAKYGREIFKKLGVEGLIMYISDKSVKSPNFLKQVNKLFKTYSIPNGFIHFEIGANTVKNMNEKVIAFIKGCNELNIEIDCADFDNQLVKFDDLLEVGINTVKTKNSLIWDAERVDADYLGLSRLVDEGKRKDMKILCGGIETKEELEIAKRLGIDYISGYLIEKPQDEESFIAYLNFKQQ